MTESGQKQKAQLPPAVEFRFAESNLHRTVFISGAMGGITPLGLIQASFFSEHAPTPDVVKYALLPTGQLGSEVSRQGPTAMVRDIEVSIVMTLDTARNIQTWISNV